jgi:hypothetical protein
MTRKNTVTPTMIAFATRPPLTLTMMSNAIQATIMP